MTSPVFFGTRWVSSSKCAPSSHRRRAGPEIDNGFMSSVYFLIRVPLGARSYCGQLGGETVWLKFD
jgi:hypothetical protein